MRLQRFIDRYVGFFLVLLFFPLRLFSQRPSGRKVLFVKLWAIGESVLTLPALKVLHSRGFHLSVLCRRRNAPVFEQPFVEDVILLESFFSVLKRIKSFDFAIDGEPYMNLSALLCCVLGRWCVGFSHGVRSLLYDAKVFYNDRQHVVRTYCDLVSAVAGRVNPAALVSLSCKKNVGKERVVGLSPGVAESGRSRLWPVKKWAALADNLVRNGFGVCFVGSDDDVVLVKDIQKLMIEPSQSIAGMTSLPEFFCEVRRFCAFVACDTGTMHVSAAQGVPTVGLFCPNTPVRFAPFGKKNTFVYKPVHSKPCINVHLGVIECAHNDHMSRISVGDILAAVRRVA